MQAYREVSDLNGWVNYNVDAMKCVKGPGGFKMIMVKQNIQIRMG